MTLYGAASCRTMLHKLWYPHLPVIPAPPVPSVQCVVAHATASRHPTCSMPHAMHRMRRVACDGQMCRQPADAALLPEAAGMRFVRASEYMLLPSGVSACRKAPFVYSRAASSHKHETICTSAGLSFPVWWT